MRLVRMNRAAVSADSFLGTAMACCSEDIKERAGVAFRRWSVHQEGCLVRTDDSLASGILHPRAIRRPRRTFLADGHAVGVLSLSSTCLSFSRHGSITSSFAPQNTCDGKTNSCANAAER